MLLDESTLILVDLGRGRGTGLGGIRGIYGFFSDGCLTLTAIPIKIVGMAKKKKAKKKRRRKTASEKAQAAEIRLLSDRIDVLGQVLKFKQFLGSSFQPTISDAEIVVCFADIRGFTNYCRTLQSDMQDRKIQNFLRVFCLIFNEGLMKWFVEHVDKKYGEVKEEMNVISDYVVPTTYKNLGDGLMIVWEFPQNLDIRHQGILSQNILYIIGNIGTMFDLHFNELSPSELDAYSEVVRELAIGFGVAKGHAWRLDYGQTVDYAGSIINLARRLESKARPGGIVAQYDVSPWAFKNFVDREQGSLVHISGIQGHDSPVMAWCGPGVDATQDGFAPAPAERQSS